MGIQEYKDKTIKNYAALIIESYKKCKDIVKIKIIHSIITKIDLFEKTRGYNKRKAVKITSEKLLGWIFAIDEEVGNAHISFLNSNENLEFLSLQLQINVEEITCFREQGIFFIKRKWKFYAKLAGTMQSSFSFRN